MIGKISKSVDAFNKPVNLSEMMLSLTSSFICRVAFSKRYEDDGSEIRRFHALLSEAQAMLGSFFFADLFPSMGWIDRLTGMIRRLKNSFKGLDTFFQELIDEHLDPNISKTEQKEDIIDVLLQLRNDHGFKFDISLDHIKAVLMISKSAAVVATKPVNLSELMMSLTSTIICRIGFGKRYEDEGVERSRFHALLNETEAMFGIFFFSDYFPFMGWVDKLTGLISRFEKNFKEFDAFYQKLINEHLDPKRPKSDQEDIIDVLLEIKKQRGFKIDLTWDHIKGILMNVFVAGTDKSAASVIWAMAYLMKYPRVIIKVQEEVRNLIGGKGFVDEDDVQKLPYLKAQKLSYNGLDLCATPFNDYHREMRKLCVVHLFNLNRVQQYRPIREDEVYRMIKKISKSAAAAVATKLVNLSELMCLLLAPLFVELVLARDTRTKELKEVDSMCY
ncbi:hypothetical protein JRO89_XS07G0025500 [Xanthoceras sorbifolium]|uniref:Cytochrome P450 n=1 Tax=Xanthoceras sorbifolium TaxID=99658 RepID=A0ABQ8HSC2_9ROSI|nr:hypothetical protein JRO89_XS07G0025500 [Xanthoceras sorbifolium]